MPGAFPGRTARRPVICSRPKGSGWSSTWATARSGSLQRFAGLFSIDAICLSHLHADHCVDLGAYWVARQYTSDGPRPPIPVHGPRGTAERVAGFGGEGMASVQARFTFRDLEAATTEIGPFRVTADHVNHPVETFGFRVEHAGWRLAYSGDTGESDALVRLAEGADLLLCEASFLDGPHNRAEPAPDRAAGGRARGPGRGRAAGAHPPGAVERPGPDAGRGVAGLPGPAVAGHLGPGARPRRPSAGPAPLAGPAPHPPPADRLCVMSRPDGRSVTELRPVKLTRGWLDHAEGSVLVEFGRTRVLCAASVTEDVPRWRRGSGLGWVTAEYAMLPRATNTRGDRESVKGRLGGRTQEISRLVGRSLRACVDYKALGENTIVIDCDVLQADGGTRTAAVTGGYVALADAVAWLKARKRTKGDPLLTSVSAVSVGIVDGEPRLDLCYEEDVAAQTDMNVVCTASGDFVEIQGTAEQEPFSRDLLGQLLDLAVAGCGELTRLQREALGG